MASEVFAITIQDLVFSSQQSVRATQVSLFQTKELIDHQHVEKQLQQQLSEQQQRRCQQQRQHCQYQRATLERRREARCAYARG